MSGILFVEDLNDVNDVSQNVFVVEEPTCKFETFFKTEVISVARKFEENEFTL